MRPLRDETWLNVAAEIARRSTCMRRAVGCVLLNARGHVLSTGYNGRAAGLPHCNEYSLTKASEHARAYSASDLTIANKCRGSFPHACEGAAALSGTQLDACEAVHAECNALLQCRDVYEIEMCYVTVSPCVSCTKLLLNTTCQRIVFREVYAHDAAARALWQGAGRVWSQFSELKSKPVT